MSKNDFLTLCNEATVAPDIALENEDLARALRDRNDEEVARILREEF